MSETKFTIGGHSYEALTDTTVVLAMRTARKGDSVVIPATVENEGKQYEVTQIGYGAFQNRGGLISITIPDSVVEIGNNAFHGCEGLVSMDIPDSVVKLGSGWGDWRSGVFYNCTSLGFISLGKSLEEIGSCAFRGCVGLPSIDIPDSVRSIGYRAFERCTGLTSVTLPPKVTEIADNLFEGCSALTAIQMLGDITYVGSQAFDGCTSLTSISIPESVKKIGNRAFGGCSSLSSMKVPSGTEKMGSDVFKLCTGLTSVTISDSIDYLGGFEGCSSLSAVVIPGSVRTIGWDAFKHCTSLVSIDIPHGVTGIKPNAFYGCTGLKSVTIPDSVVEIGGGAFEGCSSLTSLTIPDSVTEIADDAFEGCTSLAASGVFVVDGISYLSLRDGEAQIGGGFLAASEDPSALRSITIPSSVDFEEANLAVVSIGRYAFKDCAGLKSVSIPETVTEIGDHAFGGCERLKSVIIPGSVVSIGVGAFGGCEEMESVSIPDSVAVIGADAFRGCDLKYVHIPASIGSIGDDAFMWCPLRSVTVPEGDVELGDDCFRGAAEIVVSTATLGKDGSALGRIGARQTGDSWREGTMVTVRAGADSESLFMIWVGANGESARYYSQLESCWRSGSSEDPSSFFDFQKADSLFDTMKKAGNKANFALGRLACPLELADDMREKYQAYVKRSATKALNGLAENDYSEILRRLEPMGLVTKKNLDALIEHSTAKGSSRTRDYLTEVQAAITGVKTASAGPATLAPGERAELNESVEDAVNDMDAAGLEELLGKGASANSTEGLVARAAKLGDLDSLKVLLKNRAQVDAPDSDGNSGLYYAVQEANLPMVELLVENGASTTKKFTRPDSYWSDEEPLLVLAGRKGEPAIITVMIQSTKKLSNRIAVSVLEAAVESGNLEAVEAVYAGVGEFEFTTRALSLAIEHGYADIAFYLASHGAPLDYRRGETYRRLVKESRGQRFVARKDDAVRKFELAYGIRCAGSEDDWTADFYECFFLMPRDRRDDDAVPTEKRLNVMLALETGGFLSRSDKSALLARALIFDEVLFAEQLAAWGAELSGVFRSSKKTYGQEIEYSLISDYLWSDLSPGMVCFICDHLEQGEVVEIKAAFFKSTYGTDPSPNFLAQIVSYSDSDHCANKSALIRMLAQSDHADALAAMEPWGVFKRKNLEEAIDISIKSKATRASAYLLDLKDRLLGTSDELRL